MRSASNRLRQSARCLAAILFSLASLLLLMQTVAAHDSAAPARLPIETRPQAEEPTFTWALTVSVEPGAPQAPALYSRWVNAISSIPILVPVIYNPVTLPGDATQITASVSNGQFAIIGTTIYYTLYQGNADMGWSYRTLQKVNRTGNQYKIDQRASSNYPFRHISTVFFSTPLQFVGSITFTPQLVTNNLVRWDLNVPNNMPPGYVFQTSSWLVDPDLPEPDLSITGAALNIDKHLNPPIAHLTATIRNSTSMTSTIAFLEFYNRPSSSVPPTGPLDHTGGWCGPDTVPLCPALPNFTNPLPSLAPGSSLTVTVDYSLTTPGVRDFYLQIDTFGGDRGLNFETNENNNVYSLTRGVAVDYLAGVIISGPIAGRPNNPYTFVASIVPTQADSRPLTYTWSPVPLNGQGRATAIYNWSTATPQVITVTARNAAQAIVTDTHTISIAIPLTGAAITGPARVSINIPHAYQLSVKPLTATLPFNYRWSPEPEQGQSTAVATYTFAALGEQTFYASVSNLTGPTVTVSYTVSSVPPLAAVDIAGPDTGYQFAAVNFTAILQPIEAATPIGYSWSPQPIAGQGTALARYRWSAPGSYAISVTVTNDSGSVVADRTVTIEAADAFLFLPLLLKP